MTRPWVAPETNCDWCGGKPHPNRIVVTGAGMAICEHCVELAVILIEEAKKEDGQRVECPKPSGQPGG
ncbi:ClpX C4-type zinc finger protein [Nonomuraea sp. SYSU D8015]|uniref:ClpX C4-type zinc finger protein n=1 Tax=Nonomuraea sp. SYSU D8015 TaxID=2593644 RepID=UPI0016602536|nr:ClpX C4-type zinc finger protein [Nonomuraea sp. SYSU D8015]